MINLIIVTIYSITMSNAKWNAGDDNVLKELIDKYQYNWHIISIKLNAIRGTHRTGKQCSERFYNHINGINKKPFTQKELIKLLLLAKQYGNCWTELRLFFPGRSPNQLKNNWHQHHRKSGGYNENIIKTPVTKKPIVNNFKKKHDEYSKYCMKFTKKDFSKPQTSLDILAYVASTIPQ